MTGQLPPLQNLPPIPAGTMVQVLGHWSGQCAHEQGEWIMVGSNGFHESKMAPGYYAGFYRYKGEHGGWVDGVTTGLKIAKRL